MCVLSGQKNVRKQKLRTEPPKNEILQNTTEAVCGGKECASV